MKKLLLLLLIVFVSSCDDDGLMLPSDSLEGVNRLEIHIDAERYQKLFTNKLNNTTVSGYISYGDEVYECLLRSAGSGSRYHARWGFKVDLLNNATIEGLNSFNLSSQIFDHTLLNTHIASKMYEASGFPISFNKHVFLRINGKDFGLYPMLERVDKEFFVKRGIHISELYKLSFEASFTFESLNYPEYIFDKKIPKNESYTTLNRFINAVDTCNPAYLPQSLSKFLNIENYLQYHAITSILNNYDAFTNNFYLFSKEVYGPFSIIPWDFDKAFTREDDKKLYGDNAIISKLLENSYVRNRYKEIMLNILNSTFTEQNLYIEIDAMSALIRDAYNLDPYLGLNGRYNFDNEVTDLKNYIKKRREYLLNELMNF